MSIALDVVKIVLPTYEKLFDMPYPLSKMDLVAIPDFGAGAMENWGLLLFRETALLATKQDSSISSVRDVTLTIAHEMSHMVCSASTTSLRHIGPYLKAQIRTMRQLCARNSCAA